jgi:hypothetical protein
VLAKPDTMGQRLSRWVGRHRQLMVTLVLGLVSLLVMVTLVLMMVGLVVVEWRRRAAAAREEHLTAFLSDVGDGARGVDNFAREIEGVVTGLSFAAEASLDRPEATLTLVYDPLTEAPRARKSEYYGRDISAERPSFVLAPGTQGASVDEEIRRLAVLGYQFSRVLLDSSGRGADERLHRKKRFELVGKEGAPIVWSHVITTDGIRATVPGLERPPQPGADARKLEVYTRSQKEGLVWTGPAIDPQGMGAVVTVGLPLWDRKQDLLGVAAADLSLDALVSRLPRPADAAEVFLVDREGHKVVTGDTKARKMEKWAPASVSAALRTAI